MLVGLTRIVTVLVPGNYKAPSCGYFMIMLKRSVEATTYPKTERGYDRYKVVQRPGVGHRKPLDESNTRPIKSWRFMPKFGRLSA